MPQSDHTLIFERMILSLIPLISGDSANILKDELWRLLNQTGTLNDVQSQHTSILRMRISDLLNESESD